MAQYQPKLTCMTFVLLAAGALGLAAPATAALPISIPRHQPCNLFSSEEPVRFTPTLRASARSSGEAKVRVVNYFGEAVLNQTTAVSADIGQQTMAPIDLGVLPPGYYEFELTVQLKPEVGSGESGTERFSFGVAPFVARSAEQVRSGGYRFGLKKYNLDKAWWRGNAEWSETEAVDAACKLGLQWTRELFNESEPAYLPVLQMMKDYPVNVIQKIEGFPIECYDAKRYGPLEELLQKRGKGFHWMRWTVPQKEPYQKWLRAELAKIPLQQNVFEIANEPWGRIPPEEFAEWCQFILPVVKEVRPDAIVGPNTAMGPIDWERRFIEAGGMKGMDMVTMHPYSFTPMPERRTRMSIRVYRDFLQMHMGREVPIYVTEYGWSTAPKATHAAVVSERVQAQRTTRQSLMLYAEGIKALVPHMMADREEDPANWDQWFGFFRLNHQPKPVLLAHAACARIIDGSRFIGDLWYGPGVGAMLFERDGVHTLALWTLDEEQSKGTDLPLDAGVLQVTVCDIMGREQKLSTSSGKLTLRLSGDVTYVVGVSPALAKQAVAPDQELNPDRWNAHEAAQNLRHVSQAPRIDGDISEWAPSTLIPLRDIAKSNIPPEDHSGQVRANWGDSNLYLAVVIRDEKLARASDGRPFHEGDHVELAFCTMPSRQPDLTGWGLYEYRLVLTPPDANGKGDLQLLNCDLEKPLSGSAADAAGIRWVIRRTEGGWCAEVALPTRLIKGFPGRAGEKITFFAQSVDTDGGKATRLASSDAASALSWPYMPLEQ